MLVSPLDRKERVFIVEDAGSKCGRSSYGARAGIATFGVILGIKHSVSIIAVHISLTVAVIRPAWVMHVDISVDEVWQY